VFSVFSFNKNKFNPNGPLDFSHICLVVFWEEKWKDKKYNSYKFTFILLFDKKINKKFEKKKKKAWNLDMCGGKKGVYE